MGLSLPAAPDDSKFDIVLVSHTGKDQSENELAEIVFETIASMRIGPKFVIENGNETKA